jgi:hypothetical protein
MYIDAIDELLDTTLDRTYEYTDKEGLFKPKKITAQTIKTFVSKLMDKFNKDQIKSIGLESIYDNLFLIFKKYIYMYILLINSMLKKMEHESFVNFIIEFKTIDSEIFDSEFNSKILYVSNLINQINYIGINLEAIQNKSIKIDRVKYMESLKIFTELGVDIASELQDSNKLHNVLKFIIYKKLYLGDDKIKIYGLLETGELEHLEFKYIEIIDSVLEQIDYSSLESLFKSKEYKNSFIESIYNILTEQEQLGTQPVHTTLDGKINELFKKKLLIPITDEFLRYHKDSEKYDSGSNSTKIDPSVRTNKRDNTKIRYIITKINTLMDLYKDKNSLTTSNKLFFQPLANRKAVLINDLEEINIIKKMQNIGKIQKEQNEYFNELMSFRSYPYINFRDFKQNGFSLQTNKTIESIRYSNIEFKTDPKFSALNKSGLEWRVIPTETTANIVGFALPKESVALTNNNSREHSTIIQCEPIKGLVDVRGLKGSNPKSGITNILNIARDQILNETVLTRIPYLIFDKSNDRIARLREIYNFQQDEYYKFILSYIYDEISETTFEKIVNELNSIDFINFYTSLQMVKQIQKKLLPVSQDKLDLIEKIIFISKSPSFTDDYDIQEDKIPGVTIKLKKVPSFPVISEHKIRIKITKNESVSESTEENPYENSYCQHNVTWEKIIQIRNKAPNQFNQYLYEFFKHYVIENAEKEFICKSCSEIINLKKYINDWTSSTEEGIALTISLNAQLEELPEYEKFNKSIKNLDKIVEKICAGLNLNILTGNKPQTKIKRQEIIKMLIDLILIQNETIKMNATERKNRLEQSSKKYGIGTELSQFFLFELKNDIFVYSSKDTDKFKKPKLNNIMVYLLLLLVCEMTQSSIYFFPEDKMLNYFIFDRLGYSLFDNLMIRINSANDVTAIKSYKLLCYTIFIISGVIIKYNLWFGESTAKKGSINPTEQKIIIHTLVDMLNSILEINSQKTKNFLYEMFASRFFSKLSQVYSKNASKDIISKMEDSMKKKISISADRKMVFKTSKNIINTVLTGKFEKFDFGFTHWANTEPKFNINKNVLGRTVWSVFTSEQINKFYDEFLTKSMIKLAKNYNLDGTRRIGLVTDEEIAKIDKKDLVKLKDYIIGKRLAIGQRSAERYTAFVEKALAKLETNKNSYDQIMNQELKSDLYKTVDGLIEYWESIIGKDININNENIYLRQNVYIINHNFRGQIKQDITIHNENENKVLFKKDDTYFKQNIFYYWDKTNNLTIYWSAQDYNYLGYKEQGKDYVRVSGSGCSLQVKLAIKNKLLFLGYPYLNYRIPQNILDELNSGVPNKNMGYKLNNFVAGITRERIVNLKNTLINIQKIFYQIKNKINPSKAHPVAKNYINKFKSIQTTNKNNKFLDQINQIAGSAFYRPNDFSSSITYEKDYLYVGNIIKFQNSDHVIISYLCNQIKMLIDSNSDNFTKTNLIFLFANIINYEFNFYNLREKAASSSEVKKSVLSESAYFNVIETTEADIFKDLSEDEETQAAEENYDSKEMDDALDIDTADDDEGDYSGEQISRQYFSGEISE